MKDFLQGNSYLTIFIPITRRWVLDELFRNIKNWHVDDETTDLLFYIDSDDEMLLNACKNYMSTVFFKNRDVVFSGNRAPSEISTEHRRKRIADAHNEIKKHIKDTRYTVGVEDDTLLEPDAIPRLLNNIKKRRNAGFVEGVQVGRWGKKMIGAWRVNDIENPTQCCTLPAIKTDEHLLEKIDGGGFYCFITPTRLFKETPARYDNDFYGPDVNYGIDLRKKGFENYIDWSIHTKHRTQRGVLVPRDADSVIKGEKTNGVWKQL